MSLARAKRDSEGFWEGLKEAKISSESDAVSKAGLVEAGTKLATRANQQLSTPSKGQAVQSRFEVMLR